MKQSHLDSNKIIDIINNEVVLKFPSEISIDTWNEARNIIIDSLEKQIPYNGCEDCKYTDSYEPCSLCKRAYTDLYKYKKEEI